MKSVSYVIISPVRNEANFLPEAIQSVSRQTVVPARWVIVNDGSTDETGEIADQAAREHDWVSVVHRPDRGFRKSGSGVMDAFYDGYRLVEDQSWDYVLKLDGDLSFAPSVLETVFRAFEADPRLGIAGGDVYHVRDGETVIESRLDPAFHVRGATKVYRQACWHEMNGIPAVTGWDTLDEVKANMLGWETRRVEEARFLHLRPTGGADGGWRNAFKNGRGSYISGYHPLYMLAKCVRRLPSRPMVIQSLGLGLGFFSGYFSQVKQISDRQLVRYLRRQQVRRLVGLPSVWR